MRPVLSELFFLELNVLYEQQMFNTKFYVSRMAQVAEV